MLTMMKLSGSVDAIADYHCNEENYYYSQSGDVEKILSDSGIQAQGIESLDYVKVYGKLCGSFFLGQGSTISEATFSDLLKGHDNHGTKRTREHKIHGYDLTFSAPKTVSIAGLVVDKDPEIVKAHDQAVLEVMAEVEQLHASAQPTPGEHVQTGKLLFATVRDGFSREHDPHLHTHVVVMNVTEHDGKIMALSAKELMTPDFNKTWGAVYRAKLAARLRELGYNITYTKAGEWRLDKISYAAELMFSTRRQQILEAEADGKRDMDAWRKTRKEKQPFADKSAITTEWHEKYRAYAAEREEKIKAFTLNARTQWAEQAVFSVEAYQEKNLKRDTTSEAMKWQLAARRATDKSAVVSRQAIVCEYLNECMRGGTFEQISFTEVSRRLDEQVRLGHIVETEHNRFTSWEMIVADRQYMDLAGKTLSADQTFAPDAIHAFVAAYNSHMQAKGSRTLSDIQSQAVYALLASQSRLSVVQGDAGAGKTTSLKAVADFYKDRGIEVVGLAMQGVAANNLQEETGVASATLASFLSKPAGKSGRVLIVDEASMLDSRTTAKLFAQAELHNDKIILVGDVNQLESISAGRVFERLVEDYRSAGELVSLNENFRQKDAELRRGVDLARAGKMGDSLNILDERGDIVEIEDARDRRNAIADRYDRDTLVITTTQAARDELNARIRARQAADGAIDENRQITYDVARQDQDGVEYTRKLAIAPNDIITFGKNEYKHYDVRNGERGTVTAVKDGAIVVQLSDNRAVTIDMKKYRHIDYGYALTTFKAQGQTYNKVMVDSDTTVPSLNDMRNTYVNITRAREDVKIYTDDKDFLKELSEIKTHASDTLSRADILLTNAKEQEKRLHTITAGQSSAQDRSNPNTTSYNRDY